MKSFLQTLYFQKKKNYPYFIQFYFACFYDTNFSDTMVEYMESYTDPKNAKIEAPLTSYTLRKSNSNHVNVALPYSSTACG